MVKRGYIKDVWKFMRNKKTNEKALDKQRIGWKK
jgi:hypothetical protein